MDDNKIKVAMVTNHFGITGIGTVMMNYCKALDKEKFDLTILVGKPIAEKYEKECRKNGIHLIALPSRHGEARKHYFTLWKALKVGHYDIVHIHGSSSMMAIELTIAKFAGIKVRIAHCHSKIPQKKFIYKMLQYLFKYSYTKGLACSELAGNWLFGEGKFQVLINGFTTEAFLYNGKQREIVRKQLDIEDNYVVGHVGRFNESKNQPFLLEVFEEVAKVDPKAVLLLVGTGPDYLKIRKLVDVHPFNNRIILYGESNNVSPLYSAMDVFVFPSKYEGLGLVAVEAEINGLPCIVSDRIPQIANVGGTITFLPIGNDGKQAWIEQILIYKTFSLNRANTYQEIKNEIRKFDISSCVKNLENIYDELINEQNDR